MNPKTITAIILILLGVVALAYQGISYTTKEKAVDLGPIQVTAEKTKTIPLPPIVGAVALVSGVVLLLVGRQKPYNKKSREQEDRECSGKKP